MNLLITGGTGYIGRNLVKYLAGKKHRIYLFVRPETNVGGLCEGTLFVFDENIEALSRFLQAKEIDGIIHLAAFCITQHKPEEIKDLILSNIYLGTAILEAAVKANIKWFLNTGTVWQNYISGSPEYCPVNLYAATKQSFIDMAKYYTEISPIRFCTLKIGDNYGPGDTRKKIITLFDEAVRTKKILNVSLGEQKIDILHIDDMVRGFEHLASMLQTDDPVEKEYALSSGKYYTLKELACIYEKATARVLPVRWGGKPYREREVMIPWSGALLPGWEPLISLEEGLNREHEQPDK